MGERGVLLAGSEPGAVVRAGVREGRKPQRWKEAAFDSWRASSLHASRLSSQRGALAARRFPADGSPIYSCYAELYDEVVGFPAYPVIRDAVERSVSRYMPSPRTAADVGCGSGLLLPYLVSLAERVYAVDRSPAMLRLARQRAIGLPVHLLCQDIRRLSLPEPVQLITCTFDTLNYLLSRRAVTQALDAMRRNLAAGGLLLFDLITGARWQNTPTHSVRRIRRTSFDAVWRIRTDPQRRLSTVDLHWRPRGMGMPECREVHVQRWYPLPRIREAVRNAGLFLREIRDLETESAANDASQWVHVVAKR